MSSNEIAISVRGLKKVYRIARGGGPAATTLGEAAMSRLRHPFRRASFDEFVALDDISLDLRQGDVVGIVGRNGAGKSTLLKVLSRITEPTDGEVQLYGRVGSLLEVGTGFHPELTGRENIFLNGNILGMTQAEVRKQFDAIVAFAGVEQFLETPVKRYSSGMYVRLAFAVAAHLESEILLVDEVLAVGDAEFQRKCLGKMKDVARSGRTVLFVSHHMQSVAVLCNRAIYLDRGRCAYVGDVSEAIARYITSFQKGGAIQSDPQRRAGSGEMRFTSVSVGKDAYECGEVKTINFRIERFKPMTSPFFVSAQIVDPHGTTILQCDSRLVGKWFDPADAIESQFVIRTPWLKAGVYRVDLFICCAGIMDRFEHACELNVIPLLPYEAGANPEAGNLGIVFADFDYPESEPVGAVVGAAGSGEGISYVPG